MTGFIFSNTQKWQNLCTFVHKKILKTGAFVSFLALAVALTGCNVAGGDKIAPKLITTNIEAKKPISTFGKVVLVFSEPLQKSLIAQNIILQYADKTPVEKEKYTIEYDQDRKISVFFIDNKLKNTSGKYFLEIAALQDLAGNRLQNPTTLAIDFKDDFAPFYVEKKQKLDKITFTFNEDIDPNSVVVGKTVSVNEHGGFGNVFIRELKQSEYKVEVKKNLLIFTMAPSLNIKTRTQAFAFVFGIYDKNTRKYSKITDLAGNQLNMGRPFVHHLFNERIAPTIITTNLVGSEPLTGELNTQDLLRIKFSEPILTSSIKSENFVLKLGNETIDPARYSLFYDKKISDTRKIDEVFMKIEDEKLQNSNSVYHLEISNVSDRAGNFNAKTQLTITFIDSLVPRFENSNIFAEKILSGTKKIFLAFSEKLKTDNIDKIQVFKDSLALSATADFSAALSSTDTSAIVITFTQNLAENSAYSLKIPATIKDLSDNNLPETLTLNFSILNENKALFATTSPKADADGSSWSKALGLQAAIDKVANDASKEYVLVAAGTYKLTDEMATFKLKDGVKLYGGFDEKQGGVRNLTASVFEGKINQHMQAHQLVTGENLSATSILDGFLLQNAKNRQYDHKGGAIYLSNSQPLLKNLTFKNNNSYGEKIVKWRDGANGQKVRFLSRAYQQLGDELIAISGGGAIYNHKSSPKIENCKFINNNTSAFGGAIFNSIGSKPSIDNSYFEENYAQDKGGAIYDQGGKDQALSLKNSSFIKNTARTCIKEDEHKQRCDPKDVSNTNFGIGGAISALSTKIAIENCKFIANTAPFKGYQFGKGGGGGALHLLDTEIDIKTSVFKENFSIYGGAIYSVNLVKGRISNSSFIGNKVPSAWEGKGGAIFNRNSSPTILNATFVDNTARDGGAIYNIYKSKPKVVNSILWNNKSGHSVYAVAGYHYPRKELINTSVSEINSQLLLQNSLVNPLSIIEDQLHLALTASDNNKSQDPLFKSYQSSKNFIELTATSPAKDAGSDSLYQSLMNISNLSKEKDQRGKERKKSTSVDMGAVEF